MKLAFAAALALAVVAGPVAAEDTAALKQQAVAITKDFAAAMKAELEQAMQSGGPLHAIAVCNEKAPAIAADHSAKSGWEVGRTSLKLRNPGNHPDGWEAKVLAQFEARKAAGEPADALVAAEMVDGRFRFMKAIPTAEACLACHGGEVKPEVAARLTELYPADAARGFKPGDLRGAFTLARKL